MEQFKTYTVTAKETRAIWIFKYDLDGGLRSFEILEGSFEKKQATWLFSNGRFPYSESIMKQWLEQLKKYFEIEIGIPEITFEYFYEIYGRKTTKKEASKFWGKMKEAERLKAVLAIKKYISNCKYSQRQPVDPIRYLRNARYEDEQ